MNEIDFLILYFLFQHLKYEMCIYWFPKKNDYLNRNYSPILMKWRKLWTIRGRSGNNVELTHDGIDGFLLYLFKVLPWSHPLWNQLDHLLWIFTNIMKRKGNDIEIFFYKQQKYIKNISVSVDWWINMQIL